MPRLYRGARSHTHKVRRPRLPACPRCRRRDWLFVPAVNGVDLVAAVCAICGLEVRPEE